MPLDQSRNSFGPEKVDPVLPALVLIAVGIDMAQS